MSEPFVWPEHALAALQQGRFEHVLEWIEQESSRDVGLLKASVYDWWGKPLDAIEALTRALKTVSPQEQTVYLWYRGLMYIQAQLPAWAEQDFDVVLLKSSAHPELTRLARAYAKVLLGDAKGALEDAEGLPPETILTLDRVVTPHWIENYANAALRRRP